MFTNYRTLDYIYTDVMHTMICFFSYKYKSEEKKKHNGQNSFNPVGKDKNEKKQARRQKVNL